METKGRAGRPAGHEFERSAVSRRDCRAQREAEPRTAVLRGSRAVSSGKSSEEARAIGRSNTRPLISHFHVPASGPARMSRPGLSYRDAAIRSAKRSASMIVGM